MNKKPPIYITVALMFVILALLIVLMCLPVGQTGGNGSGGVADLRAVDLSGSVYQLSGEWQYAPGQLHEPETFPSDAPYISLPKNMSEGSKYLNTCATYRLAVYTDDARLLTLYLPEIYTAYKLWVNGEYIRGSGVVSGDPAEGRPSFESVLVPVKAIDGKIEIVIQASDYHWMRPHMNNVLKLGENDSMYSWFFRTRTLYILAMGFILAVSFYHFALYVMRRRMTLYLSFSLLCLVCFWRLALETEGISDLTGWFQAFSGVLDGRIYLIMFFLHGAFVGMFSLYVFSRELITKYILVAAGYCVLGAITLSFIPTNIAWFTLVFAAITLLPLVLALYIALRSKALRENKIQWLYIVALVLYITVEPSVKYFADHLLYMAPVITSIYMVMAQSVIMARQFSEAQEAEQTLGENNAMLARLNRMKTEFFQNMSHDLKTPLTVISTAILNTADQLDYGMDKQDMQRSLSNAQREIMRMARLVDNMMKHSSMQEDREEMKPIDIARLLRDGSETHRAVIERNGNEFDLGIPLSLPPVYGNADTLLHVLSNLLSNANRYTHSGVIGIRAAAENNVVSVTVSDNGRGIEPILLPHIFERGISDSGTGLGLSICKSAIEAHGGKITIMSEYGKGAAVTFTLPIHTDEANV